jgi:hypothetical protein
LKIGPKDMNGKLLIVFVNSTNQEQVMKPINAENNMGHNRGVSKSYYKPTEREVMVISGPPVRLLS